MYQLKLFTFFFFAGMVFLGQSSSDANQVKGSHREPIRRESPSSRGCREDNPTLVWWVSPLFQSNDGVDGIKPICNSSPSLIFTPLYYPVSLILFCLSLSISWLIPCSIFLIITPTRPPHISYPSDVLDPLDELPFLYSSSSQHLAPFQCCTGIKEPFYTKNRMLRRNLRE